MIKHYTPKIKELEDLLLGLEVLGRDYDLIAKTTGMLLLSKNPWQRQIAKSIGDYLETQAHSLIYSQKDNRIAILCLRKVVQLLKEIADEPPTEPRKAA